MEGETGKDLSKEELLELLSEREEEIGRLREQAQKAGKQAMSFRQSLKQTVGTMLVVAAVAVLLATMVFPVLEIQGGSMEPTLADGEVTVALAGGNYRRGDLVAFYYNNKVLVKRVIGLPGEWVNIDEDGNVYINNELLEEGYLEGEEKMLGESDVEFPVQVPEKRLFVLGDNREVSNDSRSSAVGCIERDSAIGKLVLRAWPLKKIGLL